MVHVTCSRTRPSELEEMWTKSGKSSQSSLMDADEAELLEEHANIYIRQPS